MKSIKQWLIENSSEIQTVDMARIFGGTTLQIDPKLYSKVRSKVDMILGIINKDPELSEESKPELFRQMIAIMAKEMLDGAITGTSVSASKAAAGFSPDDQPVREM